jgi:Tfp pilus assembly protein PilX
MKKGMALVMVWGMIIVMCFLALAAIYLMGNQGFVAEHKIRRMQAYYTAQAGLVHAFEDIRQDGLLNTNSLTIPQSSGDMVADINWDPLTGRLDITVDYAAF